MAGYGHPDNTDTMACPLGVRINRVPLYLKADYPKSLPFTLKSTLYSKFTAKSTYRLLKPPQNNQAL